MFPIVHTLNYSQFLDSAGICGSFRALSNAHIAQRYGASVLKSLVSSVSNSVLAE